MHIPSGDLALQGSNQASNQLGKLTAGVSHFLFMAAWVALTPYFPRVLTLPVSVTIQGLGRQNYGEKQKFLVRTGTLCYCKKQNNLAERERFLGSLV